MNATTLLRNNKINVVSFAFISLFNPYRTNGLNYSYQLGESISNFSVVLEFLLFSFRSKKNIFMQTLETLIIDAKKALSDLGLPSLGLSH